MPVVVNISRHLRPGTKYCSRETHAGLFGSATLAKVAFQAAICDARHHPLTISHHLSPFSQIMGSNELPPAVTARPGGGVPQSTTRAPWASGPSSRAMPPPTATRVPRPPASTSMPPPTGMPPRTSMPPPTSVPRRTAPQPAASATPTPGAPADAVVLPSNPAPPAPVLTTEDAVHTWPTTPGYRGFIDWLRVRCERIRGRPIVDGPVAYDGASEVRPLSH
jgi:hypothetical protein